jgi:hypothetical protein
MLAVVCAMLWASLAHGQAASAPWRPQAAVTSALRDTHAAWLHGGEAAARRLPAVVGLERRWHRAVVRDGRVLVELVAPAAAATRGWRSQAQHWQVEAQGARSWLAWVPFDRLTVLQDLGGLLWARLPWPARPMTGPVLSAGATVTGATARHCQGATGQGASVLVIDDAWHGLTAASKGGEIAGELLGKAPFQSADPAATHGTDCAEVIADVAPDAAILPRSGISLPEIEVALAKAAALGVPIVSMSAGWVGGYSFGDGSGPLCDLADAARAKGMVWFAAAGNEADGAMWRGPWQDSNGDGWLEFAPGQQLNAFAGQGGSTVSIELDWDAYPHTAIDLDLYLCKDDGWPCAQVASSQGLQDGGQPPTESLDLQLPGDGWWSLAVRAKQPPPPGLAVRLSAVGWLQLQHAVQQQTLAEPASCPGAVAVGAVEASLYGDGVLAPYSSQGPTWDGRVKPDLVAPTFVETSQSPAFEGTSAACPHAAAALALRMAADQTSAPQALQRLLADAEPVAGQPLPGNRFGAGRLRLSGPAVGCLPEQTEATTCTDSCGQTAAWSCPAPCAAPVCAATEPCRQAPGGESVAATDAAAGADAFGAASPGPAPSPPAPTGCVATAAADASPASMVLALLPAWLWWGRRRARLRADVP